MKKLLTSILFSLRTAFFSLTGLAVIFAVGSQLAANQPFKQIFTRMTDIHVWVCLADIFASVPLLLWMVMLLLCAVVLFFNTAFCTSQQLRNYFRFRSQSLRDKRLRGMAYIHVAALLVLVFHAMDVLFVQRHEPVKIFVGERVTLGGYEVQVDTISYVTDRSYITEKANGRRLPSFKIPADQFSIQDNRALVSLFRDGKQVKQAEFRMFAPIRVGGTFFILDGFFIPHEEEQVGILLHKVYNPIALPFFGLYALLFSLFIYQCIITRYRSEADVRSSVSEVN